MRRSSASVSALVAALAIAPAAESRQGPNLDPGHTLLARVAEAYKALPGYVDEGSVRLSFLVAGDDKTQVVPRPFAFARPDRLAISSEPASFHLDGDRQVSAIAGRYLVSDPPESLSDETLARDPAASYIFGGLPGIPSMTLFRLLTSEDPYQAILQGVERLEREPERAVDGIECRSLRIVPFSGPVVRLLIDPQTFLVRRIEIVPAPGELPDDIQIKEISWSPGTIISDVPPDSRFTYAAPEDAREVESLAALMAGPDGEEPGAGLLGRPAPQFSLELLAEDDQVERISNTDLEGNVVLIDVWATWCVPCQPELRAIDQLLDRYASGSGPAADRLRVISLNIDSPPRPDEEPPAETEEDGESPGDAAVDPVAEIRSRVEEHLTSAGLSLDRPPIGRVAIDPGGEATEALDIQAIPMLVLIDPEGIVRAVHVGAPARVVRELASKIDALLATPQGNGPGRSDE
ncbi:TlpA family protein disulfide reductase [Tautonia plasticadhaerens]|uniref:Thiol:disulfide interchange protein TlpA n=1 Tax=Tautonia plasticadhaerens TaxID=2527974 RepID=A0A518GXC6_9BACT|nr:TlpA disulfide reductase family protein [Tautonia plasticadhaerens]QDV33231.1 Thiol:disulfide interchange protein TlpA [Tautonia plasticadhaerens]